MNTATAAYLAGALDADGCFSIKKCTQRKRNRGDCVSTLYIPRVMLGQVQSTVPWLLRGSFGGTVHIHKPATENSLPQHRYSAHGAAAARICMTVLHHLRIKPDRARVVIELQQWRENLEVRRPTYWWLKENPDWQVGPMLTTAQVAEVLGYTAENQVSTALGNGLLVAIPIEGRRHLAHPRFPEGLIHFLKGLQTSGRRWRYALPPQYQARCEHLYQVIRGMNRIGVNGTCVNHRTGHFAPIE